ncbi:hypothetical protein KSP40_PGU012307 [Platanthera guangdongensis]|uniref:Gamma-tubulin complex component n=1 Tax=Platanthera guangdongensis TaxID=2320717 RepID=A0ABR2LSJ3_9ASPA
MAGDNTVHALLEKMIQSASSPYLSILERWVYEGVINDPHGEFFIAENKSLQKESLTLDYDAKYWQQRYSLKDNIPSFLSSAAGMILTTGKYLNVMRECGHNFQVPPSENSKLTNCWSDHHYLECVKVAYVSASCELLNLVKEKYDLIGKFRSMKRYFLLDQICRVIFWSILWTLLWTNLLRGLKTYLLRSFSLSLSLPSARVLLQPIHIMRS